MSKPDSVTIDAAKAAIIVVDMENDFGAKGGMFDRAGIDISEIQKVVEPTSKVLDAARQAGLKIIYLRMAYHPDLSDLGDEGSVNRVQKVELIFVTIGVHK
jgi:ureidoacrylate peracid hydrolase